MRYSLATPYLKNNNAFFDISLGFFFNLPIFSNYTGVPELADQIETVYSLMVMKVKNV
jgi:hypothetical protein